ncbi:MAG: cellulase family glycosylhydrolase, partial [Eubacterium sp.]
DNLVIKDELGRQRIFRGINICLKNDMAVSKFDHFYNNAKRIESMQKIGVNIIRLGITWSGIEPSESQFNDRLILQLKDFVKKCGKAGIYVLLDMHQDLFSHRFHGDGAPEWAIDKSIKGKRPFAIWAEGYFYMDSVQKAFNDFWSNKDGIQDKFIKAWQYFSKQFEDCDNIIGLDYFNEPYIDKNGRKVFLTLVEGICKIAFNKAPDFEKYFTDKSDKTAFALTVIKIVSLIKNKKNLKHLLKVMDSRENFGKAVEGLEKYTKPFNESDYQKFFDKISDCTDINGAFKFFEHNYYSNLGIPFEIKTKDNYIYSPHAYDIFIDSPLYNNYSSDERIHFIIESIRKNQLKMNVPVVFGEWGGGAPNGTKWIEHIDYIMGLFEKYQWSNIYWGFEFKNKKLTEVFNRPYPVAVCGDIKEIKTDSEKRHFKLIWEQGSEFENKNVKTQIYVPDKGFVEYKGKTGTNEIEIEY